MADTVNRSLVLIPVVAALVLAALWFAVLPGSLVVYCAHDAIYAQQILDDFTRETGIPVQVRFDTEATKSLGLINLLIQERQQPRCDVFWNNELLGMVELRSQDMLEPYRGSGWERIPQQFRDPDGLWVGFAARLRVILFNTHHASADESTFESLLSLEPDRVAVAKPLFGTTLTHYTVLWHLWGPDKLKQWHHDLRLRGVREVDGNAAVKDVVAMGTCVAGLTDNDDAFVAIDDHLPVEMLPVRLAGPTDDTSGQHSTNPKSVTICIPNTVGIIKGTHRRDAAQRLVDYLTSAQAELALARSKSRQIPLGQVDSSKLSDDVRKLAEWSKDGVDLRPLLDARRDCLKWLTSEYLK